MSPTQPTSRATNNGAALPTFSDTPSLSSSISSLSATAKENANEIGQLSKILEDMRNATLSRTVSSKNEGVRHVNDLKRLKDILSELREAKGKEKEALLIEAEGIVDRTKGDLSENISRVDKSLKFAEQNMNGKFPA